MRGWKKRDEWNRHKEMGSEGMSVEKRLEARYVQKGENRPSRGVVDED